MPSLQTQLAAPDGLLATNVVRFPGPRSAPRGRFGSDRDQKGLLDVVYTSGSMMVAAEDRATKSMAARLQIFGFLNIAEIATDGTARRLRPSETAETTADRPWRISRPSWDEMPPPSAA